MRLHILFGCCLVLPLLLSGCAREQKAAVVVIFENASPVNAEPGVSPQSYIAIERGIAQYASFVDDKGVTYFFVPTRPNDTLVVPAGSRKVVELYHQYAFGLAEYLPYRAGDTVKIRYNGRRERPTYKNTKDEVIAAPFQEVFSFNNPDFLMEMRTSYALTYMHQNRPGWSSTTPFTPAEELEETVRKDIARAGRLVDSLEASGTCAAEYVAYHRYFLEQAAVVPLPFRQYVYRYTPLSAEQLAFFNDGYAEHISYRHYVRDVRRPFLFNGKEWEAPRYDFVNPLDSTKKGWAFDERAMFDRLLEKKGSDSLPISPKTLELMLYGSLNVIANSGLYPKEDSAVYLAKYREHTTAFLEETVEGKHLPLYLLNAVLLFSLCLFTFQSAYRLLLSGRTCYAFRRFYLLCAMPLSVVVALQVFSPTWYVSGGLFDPLLQKLTAVHAFLAGVYVVGLGYCLYHLVRSLYRTLRLWRSSLRVNEGSYLLCLIGDMWDEVRVAVSSFFRLVFISYKDFFYPESRERRDRLLEHEAYRVSRWHSLDVVFFKLFCALCWCIPFARWYGVEVRAVSAYAADKAMCRACGTASYLQTLLAYRTDKSIGNNALLSKRIKLVERLAAAEGNRKYTLADTASLAVLAPVTLAIIVFVPNFVVVTASLPMVLVHMGS